MRTSYLRTFNFHHLITWMVHILKNKIKLTSPNQTTTLTPFASPAEIHQKFPRQPLCQSLSLDSPPSRGPETLQHSSLSREISMFVVEMDEDVEIGNPYDAFMVDANENGYNCVCTPKVAEEYVPKVDQIFESLQEVYDFYNNYAKMAGFGIRSHSQKRYRGLDDICRKEYVCYKQGKFEKKVDVESKRSRGVLRCGCQARIAVLQVGQSTIYRISNFVEERNHVLSILEEVHILRSHRKISEAKRY